MCDDSDGEPEPFGLLREPEWITLDLRWVAVYDELDRSEAVKARVASVHLRGRLEGSRWVVGGMPFGFREALDTVKHRWRTREYRPWSQVCRKVVVGWIS